MHISAIVYHSSTGTVRRYAERLGALTGLPVYPVKQARRSLSDEPVLFMSWICAGMLMYYERTKRRLNIVGVSATGMGTEEMARSDLKEHHNLEGDALFFLPGTFQIKKLKLLQRQMMISMRKELLMRIRNHPSKVTQADRDTYDALKNGVDHYDETKLDPLLLWLSEN